MIALGSAITALAAGAGGAVLKLRKTYAVDTGQIKEAQLGLELMKILKLEREEAVTVAKESIDIRVDLSTKLATVTAENNWLKQQIESIEAHSRECQQRVKNMEEKMVSYTEELLMSKMRAALMYEDLVKLDKNVAQKHADREVERMKAMQSVKELKQQNGLT